MSATTNLARWRQLSAAERWIFIQAVVLLPASAVGLRVLGFRRWVSVLSRLAPRRRAGGSPPAGPDGVDRAKQVARLVASAAGHGVYGGRCLERSVTLWWLLLGRGIETDLQIGVRKAGTRLEAHAWVEYLGCAINDHEDVGQQFRALGDVLPPVLEHRR
jgi:hypothetical protein